MYMATMELTTDLLHESLQKYFGFDAFKGTQEAVVKSVLEGHDTFVIMPTGDYITPYCLDEKPSGFYSGLL
jgi:hypothetical protein